METIEDQPLSINAQERIAMEQAGMYADPKYSRKAAQVTTQLSLYAPMSSKPKPLYRTIRTKDGEYEEETYDSILASQAWDELVARLGRNPTKWELINETRSLAAVYDTQSATFIRDTAGFKPVDETKSEQNIKVSPIREYTEEELEQIIADERKKREEKEEKKDNLLENTGGDNDTDKCIGEAS